MYRTILSIQTSPKELINITSLVSQTVMHTAKMASLCHLFLKHTSCSLVVSENADPDVLQDLSSFMTRLVPEGGQYLHDAEGPDDMPAHIRSVLTQTDLTLPIEEGRLLLGRWQAIYLWEHRAQRHQREVILSLL